ncbi:MAG: glycosyltransferase family 1 protein [Bacteroidota bacterium]
MSEKHLHIIAFDIPYPPNYGGVIDVWHKIRMLKSLDIKIHLHCFEYTGRERRHELDDYCYRVYYYPRKLGIKQAFSIKPYIVVSRKSQALLQRLQQDTYPILFEGLHSSYYINHSSLKGRIRIFRECNIEHRYYFNLYKSSRKPFLKVYYLIESLKLKLFERKAVCSGQTAAISMADTKELQHRYPGQDIRLIPGFHANDSIKSQPGTGDYVLYHGNLEVPENENAALFLLKQVFPGSKHKLIVAGMNPRPRLLKAIKSCSNTRLIANPSQEEMDRLISQAHINLLVTFQATGLKLKLLNALHLGRFTLVNDYMVKGTYLEGICDSANSPEEMVRQMDRLFEQQFTEAHIQQRRSLLEQHYSNSANARKLLEMFSKQ